MTDAEALEILYTFAEQHAGCEERFMITELSEDRGGDGIRVVRQCERCHAQVAVTMTRVAAAALLGGHLVCEVRRRG
jgi:hypothetical protein